MDLREIPPPPPSAASNMMVGVGPNPYPTSMSNSNNAMMGHNSAAAHMMSPASRFPFNSVISPVSKPLDSQSPSLFEGSPPGLRTSGFNIETEKKKRGRPRKYSPDGRIALGLSPTPMGQGNSSVTPFSEPPAKKNRGRPPGSGKKQMDALGTGGVGFTPHVILVNPGEDIASKIMAFSEQGPRTICVLSANGAVCNVTLCQPASSGGTMSYEGKYELISLSGSYLFAENHGSRRRSGGLSVILAGADGRVLGGGVTGILLAATQVQVIVGSFMVDKKKTCSNILKSSSASAPPPMLNFGTQGTASAASPSSQMASSDSSDENPSSPLNPPVIYNATQPNQNNLQMYRLWATKRNTEEYRQKMSRMMPFEMVCKC